MGTSEGPGPLQSEHSCRFSGGGVCSRTALRSTLVLAGIVLWISLLPAAYCQEGFISVDCGGKGGFAPVTNISWEPETRYLYSAEKLKDEAVLIPAIDRSVGLNRGIQENPEQIGTALAFLPGLSARSKYCFSFNVSYSNVNSTSYLIRAMFPTSNLTANLPGGEDIALDIYGTRFYFTVDSTFISTIELDPHTTQTRELVVTSLDETMHICLVPLEDKSSMPAISTLELRPLPQTMYPRAASRGQSNIGSEADLQSTYLLLVSRLNFGGNESAPAIRYPSDKYDRMWYAAELPKDRQAQFDSVTFMYAMAESETGASTSDILETPRVVMMSAWEGQDLSSEIYFSFDIQRVRSFRPLPTFYLNMMFRDPASSANGSRMVNITLEDSGPEFFRSTLWASFAVIETGRPWRWFNYKQGFFGDEATFRLEPTFNSSLPAMINAIEVYGEFEAVVERTSQSDVTSLRNFSHNFAGDVDTAGDPCMPVPWDWLVCSIEIPPRVTQINITSRGLTGELQLGSLDRLTVLDLSHNQFSGSLPPSLIQIVTLRALNLEGNIFSGELPLFQEKSLANLETLSLSGNSLDGFLEPLVNALDDPVHSLDFSRNRFNGTIPSNLSLLKSLKSLDLSYNELSGTLFKELWELTQLKTLSCQYNELTGTVPDEIWSSESKLLDVNLQNNRFNEVNLTSWAKIVLENDSLFTVQPRVSLVGNDISSIILPAEEIFERLNKPSGPRQNQFGFILIGGNPWCTDLEGTNKTLVQRYLCRVNQNEEFLIPLLIKNRGPSKRTLIIIGITCGLLVLLMATVLIIFLWKVGRRMFELRQIQEVLAKDDVRPPFYKYDELRGGTDDFSKANELGKGAFGTVYKAILGDGSVVAVKRLNSTEQNLGDFLKEMVLITGIKHRHLVQLRGCCVRDKQRMLVYEYAENKNLAEALWGSKRVTDLSWTQRFNICVGIARGLSYLHEELHPKIIHRDIKPQNILLDKNWNAKIADFGLARPVHEDSTQMATSVGGTLGYFSPEYATLGLFSEKLDVYSYGVLVLEIVSGRRCINLRSQAEDQIYLRTWAFRLYRENNLLDLTAKGLLTESNSDEILGVLKTALLCLQEDPNKRPTMSQVVHMLTGSTEYVALDIVRELMDQQFGYGYTPNNNQDFDTSSLTEMGYQQEKEKHALLDSNSSGSGPPNIELSTMKPR